MAVPRTATWNRKRVVILGGGFAGAYCAQKLEALVDPDEVEVVLLDRNNYFIFYPLLVEAGTGSLSPEHCVVSLRRFVPGSTFVKAEVTALGLDDNVVKYHVMGDDEPREMAYDHLVVAIGTVTLAPPVPGLKEHGYEMKNLADALALRDRAILLLERANGIDDGPERRRLLHWVVVGGSFTGIEVAGEFDQYMRSAARHYPNLDPDDVKVTVVNRGDQLLKALDGELGDWTYRHLTRRGIDVLLNEETTEIGPDYVTLKSDGRRLPCSTVVWAAGIQSNPVVKHFQLPTDKRGYIPAERDTRVKGYDHIWAIGDGAYNPDAKGASYPTTAQMAMGMGVQCAKNIARALKGEQTRPVELVNKGMLAAFGYGDAIGDVFGLKVTGWPAWFLWRSAYLSKIPGTSRKVRVAADWTLDLVTRRDFVELGMHKLVRGTDCPPGTEANHPHAPGDPPTRDEQMEAPQYAAAG